MKMVSRRLRRLEARIRPALRAIAAVDPAATDRLRKALAGAGFTAREARCMRFPLRAPFVTLGLSIRTWPRDRDAVVRMRYIPPALRAVYLVIYLPTSFSSSPSFFWTVPAIFSVRPSASRAGSLVSSPAFFFASPFTSWSLPSSCCRVLFGIFLSLIALRVESRALQCLTSTFGAQNKPPHESIWFRRHPVRAPMSDELDAPLWE